MVQKQLPTKSYPLQMVFPVPCVTLCGHQGSLFNELSGHSGWGSSNYLRGCSSPCQKEKKKWQIAHGLWKLRFHWPKQAIWPKLTRRGYGNAILSCVCEGEAAGFLVSRINDCLSNFCHFCIFFFTSSKILNFSYVSDFESHSGYIHLKPLIWKIPGSPLGDRTVSLP